MEHAVSDDEQKAFEARLMAEIKDGYRALREEIDRRMDRLEAAIRGIGRDSSGPKPRPEDR